MATVNNRISKTVRDAANTITPQESYVYDDSNLLIVLDSSGNAPGTVSPTRQQG